MLAHALAMSTGGIPLLYLGDEVGQLNDYAYLDDPDRSSDSRWVHRPGRPSAAYAARRDEDTAAGRIYGRLSHLLRVRRDTPEFAGNELVPFHAPHPAIVGFTRPAGDGGAVLVLVNVADDEVGIPADTFGALQAIARDLVSGRERDLSYGLTVPAHGFVWLRVRTRS